MPEDILPQYNLTPETETNPVQDKKEDKELDTTEAIVPSYSGFENVNRYRGMRASQEVAPTLTGSTGVGDSKLDFSRKHGGNPTIEQAIDIDEQRGRRQSTGDKWANGLAKFVGKTSTNLMGGTVGAVYGAASALYNFETDKLFNNSFAHALDDLNEQMDKKLPNYYTKYEREQEWWRKLGTANFLSDQFMNGMSFVAGAMLTEMAWAGATAATFGGAAPIAAAAHARNMSRLKRIFKVADRTADANKLMRLTNEAGKTNLLRQGGNLVRQIYTGAGYEAGVEARGHYDHLKQALIDKKKKQNGGKELTEEELTAIENTARASSNGVFAGNLLLVGGSNMLMLSKLYGPGHAIQNQWQKGIKTMFPNYGKAVRVGGKGATKTATAAHKVNRVGKALGLSEKAGERINKIASRSKAVLGTPLYEGVVEEGGQSVIDKAKYNYIMAKHGTENQKETASLLESARKAAIETYGSDDGMTEVMLGALIGAIGLPGFNSGSYTATGARINEQQKTEDIQDFMADYYNENKDLLKGINSVAEFMTESQELAALMDKHMMDGNIAAWKDVENDQMFSYVKSKVMTEQFQDIIEDADEIRNMSDEKFMELFEYTSENFKDKSDISKRKNQVADSAIKRANKIKDAFESVDDIFDFGKEKWTDTEQMRLRENMAHSLSVIENVSEREKALTYKLAEMTGGKVTESSDMKNKGAARTITYGEGENAKTFTLSDFSQSGAIHNYKKYQQVLKDIDSGKIKESPIPGMSLEDARKTISEQVEGLRMQIENLGGSSEIDLSDLSNEELELLQAFGPKMEEWGKSDPAGFAKNLKQSVQLIKDLRHLRARRHEFVGQFNNLVHGPKVARDQALQEIENYIEDVKKEDGIEGLLDPEAKELFNKYGAKATFKVGDKVYRFTPEGKLYEEGDKEMTPVDSKILRGVTTDDITTDAQEKAINLLETLNKLKQDKGEKIKELHEKISNEEQKILNYLIELEEEFEDIKQDKSGRYRKGGKFLSTKKIKDLTEFRDVLNDLIEESESFIKDTNVLVSDIESQQDYITELIQEHYNPKTGEFDLDFDQTYEMSKQLRLANAEMLGFPIVGDMESGKSLQDPAEHMKKSEDIINLANEVIDAAKTNIDVLKQKIFELQQTRDDLEKILIRKIKERKNLNTKGDTLNEIYLEAVNKAEQAIMMMENTDEEQDIPQEKRQSTPLRRLINIIYHGAGDSKYEGQGLKTIQAYRTFVKDNPGMMDPLDPYLQPLFEIEKNLKDQIFIKSELDLTDSEIASIKDLINSIRSVQGSEQDADQIIQYANNILEAGKFQNLMDELALKTLELEENVLKPTATKSEKGGDTSTKPGDTTTDPNPPTDGGVNSPTDLQKSNPKIYKQSVNSDYLYSTTTGMHNEALDAYEAILKKDQDALTQDQKNEKKYLESQLRYFRALNEYIPYRTAKGKKQVSFMAVTAKDLDDPNLNPKIKDALQGTFYNQNTNKYDNTGVLDADNADIKLVIVWPNGDPYLTTNQGKNSAKGKVTFTSAKRPTKTLYNDKTESRFYNPLELDQKEYDNLVEEKSGEWKQWRVDVLNNNHNEGGSVLSKKYRIEDMSVGFPNGQKGKRFSARGRVGVKKDGKPIDLSSIKLKIANKINTAGQAEITLGGKTIVTRPGYIYMEKNGNFLPFLVRTLEASEVDNVTNILRKISTNRDQAQKEAASLNLKGEDRIKFVKDRTFSFGDIDLLQQVKNVVFLGNITSKNKNHYKPEFKFVYDGNKKGYQYGMEGFISNRQLLDNDANAIADFKNFLLTKYHQVDAKALASSFQGKDKNKPVAYTHLVLKENLERDEEKSKEYKNYTEYLLEDQDRDSSPPLGVNVPPSKAGITSPQFKFKKFSFNSTPIGSKLAPKPLTQKQNNDAADGPIQDMEDFEGASYEQTSSIKDFSPLLNLLAQNKSVTLQSESNPELQSVKIKSRIVNGKEVSQKDILNYFQLGVNDTWPKGLSYDGVVDRIVKDFNDYKSSPFAITFPDYLAFKYNDAGIPIQELMDNPDRGLMVSDYYEDSESSPITTKYESSTTETNEDGINSTSLDDLINEASEDVSEIEAEMDETDDSDDVDLGELPFMSYVENQEVQNRDNQTLKDEIKNATRMLPWNEITKVIGVIERNNRRSYGRVLGHGKTLVSTIGPGGVAYHETYHQVSLYVLPKETRKRLYESVKGLKGKGRPGFGQDMKSFSEFTDKQSEEWLAEEFRKYILSNGTRDLTKYDTVEKGFFKRVFDLIKNFLRTHLGLSNTLQPDPSMAEVQALFENIDSGKYAEVNPDTRNDLDAVAEMAILAGKSASGSVDLMSNLSMYLGKQLFNDTNPISSKDIELLASPDKKGEFNRSLKLKYQAAIKELRNDIRGLHKAAKSKGITELSNRFAKDWKYVNDNSAYLFKEHRKFLMSFGLDYSIELEDVAKEEDRSKDVFNILDSMNFSSTTNASPLIKLLVGTLASDVRSNSTGLLPTIDYTQSMNFLKDKLSGTSTFSEQLVILKDLSTTRPWIKSLLERLGETNDTSNMTYSDIKTHNLFYQEFATTKNDFLTFLLDEQGNFFPIDSNKGQINNIIGKQWRASLRSKTGGILKIEDGNSVINLDYKIPFKNLKAMSLRDLKTNPKAAKEIKGNALIEFYEALGVTFTNPEAMLSSKEDTNELLDTKGWILTQINDNTKDADLFSRNNLDVSTRLGKLIQAELKYNDDVIELKHFTPEGKPVYGITLHSYMSMLVSDLNKGVVPQHMMQDANASNSILANQALSKGGPINISVIQGLDTKNAAEGTLTSKLGPSDRLAILSNALLQKSPIVPILRTADGKTEYGINLPDSTPITINKAKDIIKGYFRDEMQISQNLNKDGVGADLNLFNEGAKNLRIFKEIVDAPITTQEHQKFKRAVKQGLQGKMSIDDFMKSWGDYVYKLSEDYLKNQVMQNKQLLFDNRVIENTSLINNGIDPQLIKSTLNLETLPDEALSPNELNKLVEAMTIRNFIGNVEQLKVFFGDPSFYKALFKRTKGLIGTKKFARTDAGIDTWLNQDQNARFDGKKADGTFSVSVSADPVTTVTEEYHKELIRYLGKEQADKYTEIEEADAQAYASMDFYREFLIRTSDWSDSQEELFQKIMRNPEGSVPSETLFQTFPVLKPQYFGPQVTNNPIYAPYFMKLSLAPIFPQMANVNGKRTQLADLVDDMYQTQTDIKIFPTGVKVGHRVGRDGKAPNFYTKEGAIAKIDPNLSSILDFKYMGVQLDISPKPKTTSTVGTQSRTHLLANMYNGGVPVDFNNGINEWNLLSEKQKLQDSPVYEKTQEYKKLHSALAKKSRQEILDRFNLVEKNGKYELKDKDLTKFTDFIQEEVIKRQWPENIAAGINHLLKQDKGNQVFDILVNKDRVESLLFSIIANKAITQKFKGDLRVQTPSTGFETTLRAVKQEGKNQYNYPGELKFYRKEDSGVESSKTLGMEVLMPHYFKEYFGVGMEIREDGIYNEEGKMVGDNSLLEVVGFRIPTDGLHSLEFIKIKGFLPEKSGSQIVVPAELVTKSGSDFDIDKLTLYFPAYKINGQGDLSKVEYIDGEVDKNNHATSETLKKFYKNKYAPTLKFAENLDRQLALASIDLDSVDRLMTAIFKEADSLEGENIYTGLEMKVLENKFQVDKSLEDDLRIESILKQYNEFKDRIKAIPSSADFIKENKGKTIEELNSRGAIQNRIMDITKEILEDSNSYKQLLTPIGVDILKENVNRLRELNPALKPKNPNVAELISIKYVQDISTSFWSGQAGLGIAAVNSTHVVKSQQAGLEVKHNSKIEFMGETFIPSINFKGFEDASNGGAISLSRQFNVKDSGQNGDQLITEIMSELVQAYVDIADDPFIFDLNAVPEVTNAMFFLIRAGVPVDKVFTFLNQPILKEYLNRMKTNSSKFLSIRGKNEKTIDIKKSIANKYKSILKGLEQDDKMFTLEDLESMMIVDYNNMTPEDAAGQLQVMRDFFQYNAVGSLLSNLTNAQSFDTNAPKSRNHAQLMLTKEGSILDQDVFQNAEKIYSNTHVGAFKDTTSESTQMFNMFFITEQVDNSGLEKIKSVFADQSIRMSDRDRLIGMKEAENDFITAALQGLMKEVDSSGKQINKSILHDRIGSLMMGQKSLPVLVNDAQKDPRYANNPFIKALVPTITKEANDTNSMKAFSKILSTYESNALNDAFKQLPVKMQNDLIDFAILQSGISTNPQSFLSIIPNDVYAARAVEVIKILKKRPGKRLPNTRNFVDNFWKNNAENIKIVPRIAYNLIKNGTPNLPLGHSANKFPFVSISADVITDPKERKERREMGKDLPKKIKLFKQNFSTEGRKWEEVSKLGNGRFLKEYPPMGSDTVLDKNHSGNTGLAVVRASEKDPLSTKYTTNTQNAIKEGRVKVIAGNKGALKTQKYILEDNDVIEISMINPVKVKDLNNNQKKATFANELGFSGGWDALVKAINYGYYPISKKWLSEPNWEIEVFSVDNVEISKDVSSAIDPKKSVYFNTIPIDKLGGFKSQDPLGGALGYELLNAYENKIREEFNKGNVTFMIPLAAGSGLIAARAAMKVQSSNPSLRIVGVQSYDSLESLYNDSFKNDYRNLVSRLKGSGATIITRKKGFLKDNNLRSKAHASRDTFIKSKAKNLINVPIKEIQEIVDIKNKNKAKSQECN